MSAVCYYRFLVPNPILCPGCNWKASRRRIQNYSMMEWSFMRLIVLILVGILEAVRKVK